MLLVFWGCQDSVFPTGPSDPNTKKQFKLFVEYRRTDVKSPDQLFKTPPCLVYQEQTKLGKVDFFRNGDYDFSENLSSMLWENNDYLMYKIFVADGARYDGQDSTSDLVATIVILSTVDWETGQAYDRKEIPLSALYPNDIREWTDGVVGDGKMGGFWITHEGLIVFEKQ